MKSRAVLQIGTILILGLLMRPTVGASARSDPPVGLAIEPLGSATMASASGDAIQLFELTLEPHVSVAMEHHTGPMIVSVLSGEFTTTVFDSNATLTRKGESIGEATEPNRSYTLDPGDTMIYFAGTTGQTLQNRGPSVLVLVAAVLDPNGHPAFAFEPNAALASVSDRCISCH